LAPLKRFANRTKNRVQRDTALHRHYYKCSRYPRTTSWTAPVPPNSRTGSWPAWIRIVPWQEDYNLERFRAAVKWLPLRDHCQKSLMNS